MWNAPHYAGTLAFIYKLAMQRISTISKQETPNYFSRRHIDAPSVQVRSKHAKRDMYTIWHRCSYLNTANRPNVIC